METTLQMFFAAALSVSFVMLIFWCIQLRTNNAGIVDPGWVLCIMTAPTVYMALGPGGTLRKGIFLSMILFWGARLFLHLLKRYLRETEEDPRYTKIRAHWKRNRQLMTLLMFQFQALTALVLTIPFLIVAQNETEGISPLEVTGLFIWIVGFGGEALADNQLKLFKQNKMNKGKVCDLGLWNYSRHPNYFFEWVMWVAYFVFAVGSPYGFWAILSPALMFYFLVFFSGIPPAEEQSLRSRGDLYREYQKRTSAFVPWFPRKV